MLPCKIKENTILTEYGPTIITCAVCNKYYCPFQASIVRKKYKQTIKNTLKVRRQFD